MTPWSTYPPLQRFVAGDVAYLRVRVLGSSEDGAVVELIDGGGDEVDGFRRYVPEACLISKLDLLKAVKAMA